MKIRQLLECTIDVAQPVAEISAVISAVLHAIPDVDQRAEVLRKIDDEIVNALIALEESKEAAADGGDGSA
ncbi:hypothetical protein RJP21_04610 [Paenibacillus sp. VCA1]|uniref:hypothetical protein n=1 Tax=Paenibacillus sp. VCA1 TaxID=3039148 RepID=UPI00287120E5|nr:hypothetical protein [Paenibacillus sp. VCA1]MDR9852882.1 hypothetical protein [Paenibacillus sp. VCA1]